MRGHESSGAGDPPFLRLRSWTIGVVISMVFTCLFMQFINDWIARDLGTLRVELSQQPVSTVEVIQNHGHLLMWGRVAAFTALVSAVLWLCWQYQAHANVRALSLRRHVPAGLGVAAWAVPVADVILVPLVLLDLFLGSDPEEGIGRRTAPWQAVIVLAWWVPFVVGVGSLALALYRTPTSGASFAQLIDRDVAVQTAFYILYGAAGMAAILLFGVDFRLFAKEARASYERDRHGWGRYGREGNRSR